MTSVFCNVPEAPPDAIFGVKTKYDKSTIPNKQILSVGVYRTDEGKPHVFSAVRKAEERNLNKFCKDYLPMSGDPQFIKAARELLWKDVLSTMGDNISTIQTCAGTGALFLASSFAKRVLNVPSVLLSSPCWPNYNSIFKDQGNDIVSYPYEKNCKLDIDGAVKGIMEAPKGSLIVLQVVGHNPTGIDPTPEEWDRILDACNKMDHVVLFDFAYIGYASGNIDTDAEVVRKYARSGRFFFCAFSFSKCLGLYGERIGCLHTVCANPDEAKRVTSQVAKIARASWSVPPQNGSQIVATVLNSPDLRAEWEEELKSVTGRIIEIRKKFVELLEQKSGMKFDHIANQKGMFAYTGLTPDEVKVLGEREGVFITNTGRMSVPALNSSNVEFVAQAIANVVKERK